MQLIVCEQINKLRSINFLKINPSLLLDQMWFLSGLFSARTRNQGAFHVKPTPKARQALSFCTPGIFREREIAKTSQNLMILRNSSTGPNS